jgi:hypothetical protein
MKNQKSIAQKIKELKKNVANQLHDASMVAAGAQNNNTESHKVENAPLDDCAGATKVTVSEKTLDESLADEPSLVQRDSFLSQMYAKKLSMAGVEMVASLGVSYLVAWGIGSLFTLSSFWRIILGTLFAFAVNALAVYRMMRQ